jgi:hypothetical protein
MRRRNDLLDTAIDGHPAHGNGRSDIRCTVIDAGQQMGVKIDHSGARR